jgi:hypothetical protein
LSFRLLSQKKRTEPFLNKTAVYFDVNLAMKKRLNGFHGPPSRDQLFVMVLYPIITISHFLISSGFLPQYIAIVSYILESIFLSTVISFWVITETINPEAATIDETIKTNYCCFARCLPTKYCQTCHKYILGIDHHCVWLNSCIGYDNYLYFMLLVFCLFFQMIFQFAIGISIQFEHLNRYRFKFIHYIFIYSLSFFEYIFFIFFFFQKNIKALARWSLMAKPLARGSVQPGTIVTKSTRRRTYIQLK